MLAAHVAQGQARLASGDVDGAAETAARAVALDPRLPQARYLLGIADAQRRDYRHAARELQECLKLAPEFTPAASALARVYTRMGRNPEAVALLQGMLPRHRRPDALRALLAQRLGPVRPSLRPRSFAPPGAALRAWPRSRRSERSSACASRLRTSGTWETRR